MTDFFWVNGLIIMFTGILVKVFLNIAVYSFSTLAAMTFNGGSIGTTQKKIYMCIVEIIY